MRSRAHSRAIFFAVAVSATVSMLLAVPHVSVAQSVAEKQQIETLREGCFDTRLKVQANQLACLRLQTVLLEALLSKDTKVIVEAPKVTVPAPVVTVNVPKTKPAVYIARDLVGCAQRAKMNSCERRADGLCAFLGYSSRVIIRDERNYDKASGIVCFDKAIGPK